MPIELFARPFSGAILPIHHRTPRPPGATGTHQSTIPSTPSPTMPNRPARRDNPPHDASYKGFFSRKRAVADALRATVRELTRHLDFSTLERVPGSFVTERLGQRHTDMLWRVATKEGGWLYLLILFEFQSTIDRRMALRMMDYTVRILTGLGREDLGPGQVYPPVLPVVVYNGKRRWTAATDIRHLFSRVPEELSGYLPRHRYLLIDIQALDLSVLPPDNALSMIARLEQAGTGEQVEELVAPLVHWLKQTGDPVLWERFRAWITLVLAQQVGLTGSDLEFMLRNEEEGEMTTLIERSREWGEALNQQRQEKGERELVLRMVASRFGSGAADNLVPVLAGVSGSDRMAAIAAKVFEFETVEELVEWVRAT